MSLENVDDKDDGQQMPAYTISSPMSLQLRWAKNYTGYTSDSWICLFFFGTPGQLTPKWSCQNSNLSEILFLFGLSATFIKINKTKQSMLWTRCKIGFFHNKEQVTPKSIVQSGWNSISSETLCLFGLSFCKFHKVTIKLSRLYSRQGQIWGLLALKGK